MRRVAPLVLTGALLALAFAGCAKKSTAPAPTRAYRMGFTAIPPRADLPLTIQVIDLWSARADAALVLLEPPWAPLLDGTPADSIVRSFQLGLTDHFRSKGHRIFVSVDPTNGLNRSADSDSLVARGRSIAEPAIQQLYRDYCVAVDTLLRPEWMGLASETNLVRAAAPGAIYSGMAAAANTAAAAIRVHDASVRLFATVQVETAWGLLPPSGTGFVGIAQDRADFAFMDGIGLSSYPCFTWAAPESLPLDYYSRLVSGSPTPLMVIEGGWTSASLPSQGITSSPEVQRRYIARQSRILDAAGALAWFQLTFTDLDLTAVTLPPGSILPLFASMGLVDIHLAPKPALAEWDAVHARRRTP